MEEVSSLKRQRDEISQVNTTTIIEEDVFKRQKSYKDIITLLEEEEDYPNEDLSSLISTLQEEISSSSSPSSSEPDPARNPGPEDGSGLEEEEREKVMRHLLEASDDELGLPSSINSEASNNTTDIFSDEVVGGGGHVDGGDFLFPLGGEGLWEFEDHEAANYYSLLQSSEIFI
ncbi:hypothetical protein BVRB_6g154260 [Beta vulgaris subsp. vulgaris]|uniref:uncharacterized protein LOC104897945 n=1 Tax=Beta vulgaris subsp. vulgaris TaxID=3555 RepID=UPI00053FB4F0|nr:uncharacterized protein LOC104897945 [Beta vulgaris subsp. vulgaris]KMT07099.1 hypothetical protein BVRB_6g154260 [Beta vulgaris subsp. vulgaris]